MCYVSLWRDESKEDMLSATVQKDSRVAQCRHSVERQKEELGDKALRQPRGQRQRGVGSKTNTGGRAHRIAPKTQVLGCILRTYNLMLLLSSFTEWPLTFSLFFYPNVFILQEGKTPASP